MKTTSEQQVNPAHWQLLQPRYRDIDTGRAALGLISLATDRVGAIDFDAFVRPVPEVATFTTRLTMAPVATPATLAAMAPHLEQAARLLVPGSDLDCIAYSCTSGTVAIGPERVREAIQRVRPGMAVATPIDAGATALKRLGCRRITLLVPYRVDTAELVSGYFEQQGFEIVRRATFGLEGDPDMNRVAPESLVEAGRQLYDSASDALFISCTGLRTAPIVETLEAAIGAPVVTSNQALAWQSLRLAGIEDRVPGYGKLFDTA